MRWSPEVKSIVFLRDGAVIHTADVEDAAPTLRLESALRGKDVGRVATVSWSARHPKRRVITYMVRYSHDGGETWRTIAADLSEPTCKVDFDRVRGRPASMESSGTATRWCPMDSPWGRTPSP
jgi:hypothetical protein